MQRQKSHFETTTEINEERIRKYEKKNCIFFKQDEQKNHEEWDEGEEDERVRNVSHLYTFEYNKTIASENKSNRSCFFSIWFATKIMVLNGFCVLWVFWFGWTVDWNGQNGIPSVNAAVWQNDANIELKWKWVTSRQHRSRNLQHAQEYWFALVLLECQLEMGEQVVA